ncbi:MAG: hypothetical protein SFX18_11635 [Pirellulales bacterium]|nr:hypothetical protein [Pirellulales bacterium]
MRHTVLGGVLGFALVCLGGALCIPWNVTAQSAHEAQIGCELITHTAVTEKFQLLTVLDPRRRALCVYQVELATGVITLKSARNLTWDMQLLEYNSANPLPREIRTLLEQK